MPHETKPSSVRQAAAGSALRRTIRLVYGTSKVVFDPADLQQRGEDLGPFICAFWHGQFMLLPSLKPANRPMSIMVARHGDAGGYAGALAHLGFGVIRGAGAGRRKRDRGGAQALRAAITALDEGTTVGMTADVPPGPARIAGLGIVTLARLSGRPILPVAVASSRYVTLETWSRMTINLPWSTIGVVTGDPITVPRDASAEDLERARRAVEDRLNTATRRAYELAGAEPAQARSATASETGFALKSYRLMTRALTPVAPAILSYRARHGKEDLSRRDERMGIASRARPAGDVVWVHAASVGETNAVMPLIGEIGRRRPDLNLLLTTGTVTSARLVEERAPGKVLHQFVPLDSEQYVQRFLAHWSPSVAIFAESEAWPNLVLETRRAGIPLALVNARMSKRSFDSWRRRKSMARSVFNAFSLVLAQNEQLAKRFKRLGAVDPRAVGNLKIDSPPPPVAAAALAELKAALAGRPCLVAASTHDGEEQKVAEAVLAIRRVLPEFLAIIVPRHPDRGSAIAAKLSRLGVPVAQRSRGDLPRPEHHVYLADTLGELGTFYALAPLAFVGGSLIPHGGQNPIEAVQSGAGVLTGPHWHNFRDAYRELINHQGCREVTTAEELAATVVELLGDTGKLTEMRRRASERIVAMSGALDRTIAALEDFLPQRKALQRAG